MFLNEYCVALALALIPGVLAGFVFWPRFGIKFKNHQVGLVLLYSFFSTLMAVTTMIIAFIVLVSLTVSKVSSPTGADASTAIITAIIALIVLIVLTRFNVSLLTIFAFRLPNCLELPSQKRSITLAAATLALLQIVISWAAPALISLLSRPDSPSQPSSRKPTDLNNLLASPMTQERYNAINQQKKVANPAKTIC